MMTSKKDHEDSVKGEHFSVLPKDLLSRISQLSTNHLSKLEETLSKSDVCSLIFLLSDNHKDEIVLQDLCYNLFIDNSQISNKFWPFRSPGLLSKYMISFGEQNWKEKVIEALLVIQNYGVLKKWQFSINDLKIAFKSPSKWHAVYINPVRKLLYQLCDDLNESDWRMLCTAVNIEKSVPKDDIQRHGLDFPEISLLFWSSKQIIDIKSPKEPDISIVRRNLSHIKRDDWVAVLSDLSSDNCSPISKAFASVLSVEPSTSKISKPGNLEERYEVNSEKAGFCVIFNQERVQGFNEPREGSTNDAEYLRKTFECFGFEVQVSKDTRAADILQQIGYFSQKPMGCYVIAILSHGERNIIKGSDGEDVNIDVIEDYMLRIRSLQNKPKLLLVQACQSDRTYSNDIVADGGRKGHLFVYMASLPGDIAYRHKVLGSYFVNHLCDTLLENSQNANWSDVIRICNAKMEKEKFACLMPWHKCAFTKHLILVAKNEEAAKKILHEEQEKRRKHLAKRALEENITNQAVH